MMQDLANFKPCSLLGTFTTPLPARRYYSYQPLCNLSLCHLHNSKCYTSTFYWKSNRPLQFLLVS